MDLLIDEKKRRIRIRVTIVTVVIIVMIIAIFLIIYIKRNRDNNIINNYIINTNANSIITINNDMSKLKLYQKTIENIKENNKTIQVSNNEAKFVLDSNYLQESNKVNPKVTTTNQYQQLNNVVCIQIDISPVKNKQIIDKMIVDISKLKLDTEYVDVYTINDNSEFSALKLKEPVYNEEIQIDFDININKYIIAYVPVVNLAFNYNEINLKKGEEVVLTCDINENATNSQLHAQVADENIIEVSSNGIIKAINAGRTQLIIQSYKNTVLKTIDVIVKEIPQEIKVNKEKVEIYTGNTYQIETTVLPETLENKNVTYSSSNNNIVTVDSKGNITGIRKGKAKITITTEETPQVSKVIEVTVNEKPSEIRVEQNEIELYVNDTYYLNVTVLPETLENKKVKYTTSNENIATVDSDGKIKAIGEGTVEIKITTDLKPAISLSVIVHVKLLPAETNTPGETENNTQTITT